MDITRSWLFVVGSGLAVDHSRYSSANIFTRPSTELVSRTAGNGRGDVEGISHTGTLDIAQNHRMYHTHPSWNRVSVPPQNHVYIPTGNESWQDNSSHGHSRCNLHNNSQLIHESSYMHFPDHPSSSFPGESSGFTPVNQNNSIRGPVQRYYRPHYAKNFQLIGPPKCPPQLKQFRNVGPSDFQEMKKPQKK